jgi:hypothetical protein
MERSGMCWRSKSAIAALGVTIALSTVAALFYLDGTADTAEAMDAVMDDSTDTGTLVAYLSHGEPMVVSNALSALEIRHAAEGREAARTLLGSEHEYVWLAATMYLGSLGEQESIPHLIRRLGHRAWRGRARAAGYLTSMTGQEYGVDESAWTAWWSSKHPGNPLPSSCWEDTVDTSSTSGN